MSRAQQDRRERIVKTSRDCTALSKRLIFHLHRCARPRTSSTRTHTLNLRTELLVPIPCLQRSSLGKRESKRRRFSRSLNKSASNCKATICGDISAPSLRALRNTSVIFLCYTALDVEDRQIEAFSFFHYLEHREVVTLEQVREKIAAHGLHVTEEDYLCGLADMTGELMRLGVGPLAASLCGNVFNSTHRSIVLEQSFIGLALQFLKPALQFATSKRVRLAFSINCSVSSHHRRRASCSSCTHARQKNGRNG